MAELKHLESDDFALYEFEDEQARQCFALIDTSLKFDKRKKSFPYLLWIEIFYNDKDVNGAPTSEEAIELEKIEGVIMKKLAKVTDVIYAGRTTLPDFREIIIYCPDEANTTVAINRLKHDFPNYKISYALETDADWEGIAGFLD